VRPLPFTVSPFKIRCMSAASPEELSLAGSRKTWLRGSSHGLSGSPHSGTHVMAVFGRP
jgi:hypothetical protein